MGVPCVRVPREAGEETRQRLAEADLVDDGYDITVVDGQLYVPVTDPTAVPADLTVVESDPPVREGQTMPADGLGFDPSYERIGDVAIVDEDDDERARTIADAIMTSDLPVRAVLNRASKIKGEQRVRDWDVLAGEGTAVTHREYGCTFLLPTPQRCRRTSPLSRQTRRSARARRCRRTPSTSTRATSASVMSRLSMKVMTSEPE